MSRNVRWRHGTLRTRKYATLKDRSLLVMGARHGSLGYYIANQAKRDWATVATAGISGQEDTTIDVVDDVALDKLLNDTAWTDVVCTIGINGQEPLWRMMLINAQIPLVAAEWWAREAESLEVGHVSFVGISSNSAHVPRSNSAGYCASKAALSMGLRCLGRKYAKRGGKVRIWGYEPGFLEGTPMSTEHVFDPPHRMPQGGKGIDPELLAMRIVQDLYTHSALMMGTMQRIDAGDM
jgi:hypothetical protein